MLRFLNTESETIEGHEANADETHHNDIDEDHSMGIHVPIESSMVLLIFTMLFAGGILRFVSEKTHIPYTPMILMFGMIFGRFYFEVYEAGIH